MKPFLKSSWPFILLAVLSFTLHFAFLSYPSQVVFDEVHFGKFVAAYSTGQYYFDIHPPLGKLMIAGFVKLASINPVFGFGQIGENIPGNTLFILRFLPAFFGSLFVLVFSWLAYLISRNKTTALIAGFLILLDNAFLVQSKFILVDIFMLCFEVLALCFFFLWQQQAKFKAKWFEYLALTGLFTGLTISVKWTGLAVIGIIGIILLVKIFSKKLSSYLTSPQRQPEQVPSEGRPASPRLPAEGEARQRWQRGERPRVAGTEMGWLPENDGFARAGATTKFKEAIVSLIILPLCAFLVYLLPFYLHFKLLPNSGPGDAFMSQPFQQELKYGRDNVYQPLTFWQKFTELNKTMYTANANLVAEHPFGSRWYNWPLNSKPVYYWNQDAFVTLPDWRAKIYFSGNPILWWLAGLSVIFTFFILFSKKIRRHLKPIGYLLLLGYFTNLLPFIFIKRVSFLYHYLPSLLYAVLVLALWLGKLWDSQKTAVVSALILIAAVFILLSPLSYGWPLPPRKTDRDK